MELRRDYFLDRWVIASTGRGKRPHDLKEEEVKTDNSKCFFCPGHEDETPPEIGRLQRSGEWYVRWFPNKFPITAKEGDPAIKNHGFFNFSAGYGEHEVIVETSNHDEQLHNLTIEHIADVLKVYAERLKELDTRSEYVALFKNFGLDAGTSLEHSHTQICSVNLLPPDIIDKIEKSHKDGKCLYCEVLNIEKDSDRRVFENENFVSFCPYASRFNYEIWIVPKKHVVRMEELDDAMFLDLARMFKSAIVKLGEKNISYNFAVFYAPKGKDLHFHVEIMPRIAKWGGFELNSGIIVNHVLPEEAAEWYRE